MAVCHSYRECILSMFPDNPEYLLVTYTKKGVDLLVMSTNKTVMSVLQFPCEHQQEGFYCIQDVSALHTFLRAMPPHTSFSIRIAPESIQFKCKHHTFTHPLQVASTNFSPPTEFKQVFECEVLQLAAALSATTNRVTLQRCKGSSLNITSTHTISEIPCANVKYNEDFVSEVNAKLCANIFADIEFASSVAKISIADNGLIGITCELHGPKLTIYVAPIC